MLELNKDNYLDNERKCIFCKIVEKEEKAIIIYEDSKYMAFMDKNPFNIGHVLVIPKKHHKYIVDMSENDTSKLFVIVNRLSKAIFYSIKADGLNIGQSNGEAASQQIFHVHVHIIPRFKDDAITGMFPARKELTISQLNMTAEIIKNSLIKTR